MSDREITFTLKFNKYIIIGLVIGLVAGSAATVLVAAALKSAGDEPAGAVEQVVAQNDEELAKFAQCVKDSGAKFYGASWCGHCKNQKKAFGTAADLLPYIECATPDGQDQTPACKDAKIEGYPTWEFADGSRQSGELPFEVLAEKTGCAPPPAAE